MPDFQKVVAEFEEKSATSLLEQLQVAMDAVRDHQATFTEDPDDPTYFDPQWWKTRKTLLWGLWLLVRDSTFVMDHGREWNKVHGDLLAVLRSWLPRQSPDENTEANEEPAEPAEAEIENEDESWTDAGRYATVLDQLHEIINDCGFARDDTGLASVMLLEIQERVDEFVHDWIEYDKTTLKITQALLDVLDSVRDGNPETHPQLHADRVADLRRAFRRLATDGWRDANKELSRQVLTILQAQGASPSKDKA